MDRLGAMSNDATNGVAGSGRKKTQRAQEPLLDRLLDVDSDPLKVSSPSATEALEQLRASVMRDVEIVLNARRRRRPIPENLPELASSLLQYGIPDPASGAYLVPEIRAALADEVAATIRRFEPRLRHVKVVLLNEGDSLSGSLKLRVEAVLRAEPVSERVSFETLLETVTRDVTLRETEP